MKRILTAVISAGLLVAAFPNYNFEILAWLALVPLLLAVENTSPLKAFFLWYLAGAIFWLGTVYWLKHVTFPGMIILVLYLALYFGIFGLIASRARVLPVTYYPLFLPSIWVLLEYLRSYLFTGFGWNLLGYSQYLNLPAIQIADFTGACGVSFLVMMVNVALAQIIRIWCNPARRKELVTTILIYVVILAAVLSYGYYRLNNLGRLSQGATLKLSVIQGNIPQSLKWRPYTNNYIMLQYQNFSRQVSLDKPDLMIWPEAALPVVIEDEPEYFQKTKDLAAEIKIPLLLGAVSRRNNIYYNSAFLIPAQGSQLFSYDKLHLVPFGEYIPLKRFFNFLETVVPIGEFSPGQEYAVFTLNDKYGQLLAKFSVLICFEDLFPQLSRQFARRGADFLVNITNDGWFGNSAAPYQHFCASVLRAVENRLPLVRAANTGVSGFIAASGRIISLVSDGRGNYIFVGGYRSEKISLSKSPMTFYTRFGEWLSGICFLVGLYGIIRILQNKK